jgi:hypothetical protein
MDFVQQRGWNCAKMAAKVQGLIARLAAAHEVGSPVSQKKEGAGWI